MGFLLDYYKKKEQTAPLIRSGSAAFALAKTWDSDYLKEVKDHPIVPEQKKYIQSLLGEKTKTTIPTKAFSSMLQRSKEAKEKAFEELSPAEKQLQKQGVDLGQTISQSRIGRTPEETVFLRKETISEDRRSEKLIKQTEELKEKYPLVAEHNPFELEKLRKGYIPEKAVASDESFLKIDKYTAGGVTAFLDVVQKGINETISISKGLVGRIPLVGGRIFQKISERQKEVEQGQEALIRKLKNQGLSKKYLPKSLEGSKISEGIGAFAGEVAKFLTISNFVGNYMAESDTFRPILRNAPLLSKATQYSFSRLVSDQLGLDIATPLKERQKDIFNNIPRYISYGLGGQLPVGELKWVPLVFGGEFISQKIKGASNEQAIKSSLLSTAMMGIFKIPELIKDPYTIAKENAADILHIDKKASLDEAKRAYRALAHQTHSDVMGGSDEAFIQVQKAYDIFKSSPKDFNHTLWSEIKELHRFYNSPEGKGMGLSIINSMPAGLSIQDIGQPPVSQPVSPVPAPVAPTIAPEAPVTPSKPSLDVKPSLIEEAKKYKSAEEFVDGILNSTNARKRMNTPRLLDSPEQAKLWLGKQTGINYDYYGGLPEKITVYRAIPKELPKYFNTNELNPFDYVSANKKFAEGFLKGDKHLRVISQEVSLKDLAFDDTGINEYGLIYKPAGIKDYKSNLTDIWMQANTSKPQLSPQKLYDNNLPYNKSISQKTAISKSQPLQEGVAKSNPLLQEAKKYGGKIKYIDRKPTKSERMQGKHRGGEIIVFTKKIDGSVRSPEEIERTTLHEIGHAFDETRRGIVADPMGDSIRGVDGKLKPMSDTDIYFRFEPKMQEAKNIRNIIKVGGGSQKEIYADAYKLFKTNPEQLEKIAPTISKEISDFYNQAKAEAKPSLDVEPSLLQEAKKYKSAETGQYAENTADLLYHGTGEKSAQNILRSGFKTGEELSKGEKTGLISLGTKQRAMAYSRGEKVGVQLPVPIKGLNLLEVKAGEIYPNNLDKYTKLMDRKGYDGIRIIDDVYTGSGKTAEVLLKKEVATSQLTDIYNKAKAEAIAPKIVPEQPLEAKPTTTPQSLLEQAEAISRPPTVAETKKAVSKITGEPSEFIRKREMTLLKDKLKNLSRGSVLGKRAGIKEIQAIKSGIAEAIKTLPNEKQFKLINTLENAKNSKDLQSALDMVERVSNDIEKRNIIETIKSDIKPAVLKELRPENKKAIEDVMADLDVAKLSPKKTIRLENLKQKIQENPNQLLSDERLKDLSRLDKTALEDMDTKDIENIRDSVKHYLKLNETENKLIFGDKAERLNKYTEEAVANVNKKASAIKTDTNLIDTGLKQKSISLRRKFFDIEMQNAETLTEQLDRDKKGVIKKLIYDDIDKGTTKQFEVKQEMEDYLKDELKDIDIKNWSRALQQKEKNIDVQTIKLTGNKTIKITKGERIALDLHSRNYDNLSHILEGGFRAEGLITSTHKISQEDLDIIKSSMTAEEKKISNVFSKVFKKIQPKLNETSVNLNGFDIARVKEYYPIRTSQLDRQRDALKLKGKFSQKTLEGMGILKERTQSKNPLILEDAFKTIYKHIEQTSSYIGLAEPLRNAKMLLGDNDFIESVISNYGNEYNKYLERFLTDVETQSYNVEGVDKLGLDLVNRLDRAILSINPGVILKQPLSYFTANIEIDYKYLQKALATNPNKGVKEMIEKSPQLRERMTGKISRELGELANAGAVRNFFLDESPLSGWLIKGIEFTDRKTVGYVWNAIKMEVADKYPDLKGNKLDSKIVERAEEVIRKTQPTYLIKDRSQAARRETFAARILTRFQTQLNKNYNAGRRSILEYDISEKTVKDKSKLLKALAIITIVNGIAVTVINNLKRKLYRKEPKRPITNAVEVVGNSFSSVYGVGTLFSAISSNVEKGMYGSFDPDDPIYNFGNSVADVVGETVRAVEQASKNEIYKSGNKKGEAKWKNSVLRALDNSARIATEAVAGLPYWNIKDIAKIITRNTEEDTKKEPTGLQLKGGLKLKGKGLKLKGGLKLK